MEGEPITKEKLMRIIKKIEAEGFNDNKNSILTYDFVERLPRYGFVEEHKGVYVRGNETATVNSYMVHGGSYNIYVPFAFSTKIYEDKDTIYIDAKGVSVEIKKVVDKWRLIQ